MQYAKVSLLSQPDSTLVNGIITERQGKFMVRAEKPGNYIVRINFIGYEAYFTDITLTPDNPSAELDTIQLTSSSVAIGEVSIQARQRSIEYKIDRKVVHVADYYTAVSGTALDILKNVPSIFFLIGAMKGLMGEINGEELNRGRFTRSVEWNSIFKITESTRIQFNAEYDNPEIEAQETESATFEFDATLRQSFMDNRHILTLQLRDMFATDRHESEIDAIDFYSYRFYKHRAPIVMLNLTYRINNFGNNGDKNFNGGSEEGGFEGGEM